MGETAGTADIKANLVEFSGPSAVYTPNLIDLFEIAACHELHQANDLV